MKKKTFNKKLVLKKGVISNLNMSKVKGGEKENTEVLSLNYTCEGCPGEYDFD